MPVDVPVSQSTLLMVIVPGSALLNVTLRPGKTKPLANADLWKELDRAISSHQINWHWVKGHAGRSGNERADRLAVQALKKR